MEQLPGISQGAGAARGLAAGGPAAGRDGHPAGQRGAGRGQFEQRLEERRRQESGGDWQAVREGWCLGEETFRQELLAQMGGQMGEHHYGAERAESVEDKAGRIVAEELKRAGWTEAELPLRPKGDPVKLAAATRLRQETTVTLKWITQRLAMGAWTHLNRRLYEQRRNEERITR